jgi:hypothetical protein
MWKVVWRLKPFPRVKKKIKFIAVRRSDSSKTTNTKKNCGKLRKMEQRSHEIIANLVQVKVFYYVISGFRQNSAQF